MGRTSGSAALSRGARVFARGAPGGVAATSVGPVGRAGGAARGVPATPGRRQAALIPGCAQVRRPENKKCPFLWFWVYFVYFFCLLY